MINLTDKYYKKALKTLWLKDALKECKTFDSFKKYVAKVENTLEINRMNLETAKNNIPIAKSNIEVLKDNILTCKQQLESEDIKYNKRESTLIKERITEYGYLIEDMTDAIIKAQNDIASLPENIEAAKEWLNDYLYLVEPQMKIERIAELNKGKNYQYTY